MLWQMYHRPCFMRPPNQNWLYNRASLNNMVNRKKVVIQSRWSLIGGDLRNQSLLYNSLVICLLWTVHASLTWNARSDNAMSQSKKLIPFIMTSKSGLFHLWKKWHRRSMLLYGFYRFLFKMPLICWLIIAVYITSWFFVVKLAIYHKIVNYLCIF